MNFNRIQDQIAIVGVGSTGYDRENQRSPRSLATEAVVSAIQDAGLKREDIDGMVSSTGAGSWLLVPPGVTEMVAMLRLPNIRYFGDGNAIIVSPMIEAMNAIYSGACDIAVVYHYNYRTQFTSRKTANDQFRRSFLAYDTLPPENARISAAYAAWCSRYLHENSVERTDLAYVAVNSRTNARDNPLAAMRTHITVDDYLQARMVRDPLSMFDMDLPVDGAEAFVLTSIERARDMAKRPVLIHTALQGLVETASDEEQLHSLNRHGQDVVVEQLWKRSSRGLDDVDIAYIYEGFTFIALSWIEKLGWCGRGEAGAFLKQHWNAQQNRVLINGRIPVNSNGGMLAEGGTQGAGVVREAVHQLRGTAGDRQIPGNLQTALLTVGGFFFNSQAMMLVADS